MTKRDLTSIFKDTGIGNEHAEINPGDDLDNLEYYRYGTKPGSDEKIFFREILILDPEYLEENGLSPEQVDADIVPASYLESDGYERFSFDSKDWEAYDLKGGTNDLDTTLVDKSKFFDELACVIENRDTGLEPCYDV